MRNATTEDRYKYSSRLRSVWSNKYFDWIITQMNANNELHVGIHSEEQFNKALEEIGVTPPSSRTMKDVMKELVVERLLIRIGWGLYKVNPLIEWRGQVARRTEEIRTLAGSGVALQPNVEPTPQGSKIVQPPTLASSRVETFPEIIAEGTVEERASEDTDNEGVI